MLLKQRPYNRFSRNIFPFSMEGCVLYVPLWQEDLQGSPFLSYDPVHYSCAVTGATWDSTGRTFDDDDDKIVVLDAAPLSALGPVTIISRQAISTLTRALWSKYAAEGSREWFAVSTAGGALSVCFTNSSGGGYLTAIGANNIDGLFHTRGVTWDGVNDAGHIKLYIDGQPETLTTDTITGAGANHPDTDAPVELGRHSADNATCFGGVMSDFAIFNRVLSAAEMLNFRF